MFGLPAQQNVPSRSVGPNVTVRDRTEKRALALDRAIGGSFTMGRPVVCWNDRVQPGES